MQPRLRLVDRKVYFARLGVGFYICAALEKLRVLDV